MRLISTPVIMGRTRARVVEFLKTNAPDFVIVRPGPIKRERFSDCCTRITHIERVSVLLILSCSLNNGVDDLARAAAMFGFLCWNVNAFLVHDKILRTALKKLCVEFYGSHLAGPKFCGHFLFHTFGVAHRSVLADAGIAVDANVFDISRTTNPSHLKAIERAVSRPPCLVDLNAKHPESFRFVTNDRSEFPVFVFERLARNPVFLDEWLPALVESGTASSTFRVIHNGAKRRDTFRSADEERCASDVIFLSERIRALENEIENPLVKSCVRDGIDPEDAAS